MKWVAEWIIKCRVERGWYVKGNMEKKFEIMLQDVMFSENENVQHPEALML